MYSDVFLFDDCNDDVNGEGDAFLARVHSIAIEEGYFTSYQRDHNNVGEVDAHSSPAFVNDLGAFFPGHSAWGDGAARLLRHAVAEVASGQQLTQTMQELMGSW